MNGCPNSEITVRYGKISVMMAVMRPFALITLSLCATQRKSRYGSIHESHCFSMVLMFGRLYLENVVKESRVVKGLGMCYRADS